MNPDTPPDPELPMPGLEPKSEAAWNVAKGSADWHSSGRERAAAPSPHHLPQTGNPDSVRDSDEAYTSLDNRSSSEEFLDDRVALQKHFFRKNYAEFLFWSKVIEKAEPNEKRVDNFKSCSSAAWMMRSESRKRIKVTVNTCNHRLCPRCQVTRRREIADRIQKRIGPAAPDQWRFITLTIGDMGKPLKESLDHLKDSFRRLRETTLWQEKCIRGWGFIEVTYSADREAWHPHLHVLVDGDFIEQKTLSKVWMRSCQGSPIVDIRKVESTQKAIDYVLKYPGKPPKFEVMRTRFDKAVEFYHAMDARRLVITFGDHPVFEYADDEPEDKLPDDWQFMGALLPVIRRAAAGDKHAIATMYLIEHDSKKRGKPPP